MIGGVGGIAGGGLTRGRASFDWLEQVSFSLIESGADLKLIFQKRSCIWSQSSAMSWGTMETGDRLILRSQKSLKMVTA